MVSVTMLVRLAVAVGVMGVGWRWYQSKSRLPPVVEGFFLPEYRPVAHLFRQYVADGTEPGGSFAVYHRGRPLVDLWGGYADLDSRRPWRNGTLSLTGACTQGVTALVVSWLVDRGLLDYEKPLHHYWPQFASNGKSNITLRMLISHQAGLVTLGGRSFSLLEYTHDFPTLEQFMAVAVPDYPPGSQSVYHAHTLAMYVDALVRRVDPQHRNLTQLFQEEIAKPFGLDFHIGLPRQQYHRAARLHTDWPSVWEMLIFLLHPSNLAAVLWNVLGTDTLFTQARNIVKFVDSSPEILNDPLQSEVGLGSLVGFGSASSLAKMYDILANQGSAGKQVLMSKSLTDAFSIPISETIRMGVVEHHVYSLGFQVTKNILGEVMFGHGGSPSNQGKADPKAGLGIAYITNYPWKHLTDPPHHYQRLEQVFYDCFLKYNSKNKER